MKDLSKMANSAWENAEPIFMIRAQDKAAIAGLTSYLNKCEELDCSAQHLHEIRAILAMFEEYARTFDTKVPD